MNYFLIEYIELIDNNYSVKKVVVVVNMSIHEHVVVMPFPAQGHVTPIMKLAQQLVTQGVKVTFVNVYFFEARVLDAMSETLGTVPHETSLN